jgi:hypothetical protein
MNFVSNATACCGRHFHDGIIPEEVKKSGVNWVIIDLKRGWPPLV